MDNSEKMSVDDEQQMLAFLEHLKIEDPVLYSKTIAAIQAQDGTANNGGLDSIFQGLTTSSTESDFGGNLNLPGLKKVLGKDGVEEKKPSIAVTPDPGFVIKTREVNNDHKVFINLCIHNELEAPSMKKRLNDQGESVEGMNIPLSVGPMRTTADKSGIACSVYDIIVNPQVVRDIQSDVTGQQRDFVCQLAIQALEQKYKLELDKRYKLPKLKYTGSVETQFIQDRKKMPKIEEVAPSVVDKSKPITQKAAPVPTPIIEVPLVYSMQWVMLSECGHVGSDKQWLECPTSRLAEYSEPMQRPPVGCDALQLVAEFDHHVDCLDVDVSVSPFKLQVKITGYRPIIVHLPVTLDPAKVRSILKKPIGYVRKVNLVCRLPIDQLSYHEVGSDPGSKQWLLAKALQADGDAGNPYVHSDSAEPRDLMVRGHLARSVDASASVQGEEEDLPEDKFHVKLPRNVDKYTGVPLTVEDEELPEERFHKKDAQSSYIIDQRDQAVKDKREKADREREERKADPNIEYIEVDDYKPGGKYGPPVVPTSSDAGPLSTDAANYRKVAAEIVGDLATQAFSSNLDLSSKLWTELLD